MRGLSTLPCLPSARPPARQPRGVPRALTAPCPPRPRLAPQGAKWGLSAVPSNFVMAYLVLAVLSAVTHLRTFSVFRTVQVGRPGR